MRSPINLLQPKTYGEQIVENKKNNELNITREDMHGFFSSCSLCLWNIVDFIKEKQVIPDVTVRAFPLYQEGIDNNIYDLFFMKNSQSIDVDEFINANIKFRSNNIFYKQSDRNYLGPIIQKWFTPQLDIQLLKNNFIIDLKLNVNETLALYYRGTDTQADRRQITYYNILLSKAMKIIKQEKINKILLQTDDKMFEDYVMASDLRSMIVKIKDLPAMYSILGLHYVEKEKIIHAKNMLAAVSLMSECKYMICNTSNISRWIWLYRKHQEYFYQFLGNKEYK